VQDRLVGGPAEGDLWDYQALTRRKPRINGWGIRSIHRGREQDIAAILSQAPGKEIRVVDASLEDFAACFRSVGMP